MRSKGMDKNGHISAVAWVISRWRGQELYLEHPGFISYNCFFFLCVRIEKIESASFWWCGKVRSLPARMRVLPASPHPTLSPSSHLGLTYTLSALFSLPPLKCLCEPAQLWMKGWDEEGGERVKQRGRQRNARGGSQVLSLLLHNGPGSRPLH